MNSDHGPARGQISWLSLLSPLLCLMLCGCGLFSRPAPQENYCRTGNVVDTACSQMGKKYVAGGASPQRGFDCSGLVWWSYKQHGVNIPRITTDQAKTGKAVHKKHIRAGDIVVFRTSNSPRGLHTGIYAGKGSFVHSPGTGKKVCMEKIHPYWTDKLIAIRRIGRKE